VNGASDQTQIRRTILIVDDQRSVLVSLEYLLELMGYRALTAESGSAGIALAEKETIDGALIDIHMPVMDGFEVCVRLKALVKTNGHPFKIWFMSAALSGKLKRRAFELGAIGALAKPFDFTTLSNWLEEGFLPQAPPSPTNSITNPAASEPDEDS
jgi:CheY-like chemotaxis protein